MPKYNIKPSHPFGARLASTTDGNVQTTPSPIDFTKFQIAAHRKRKSALIDLAIPKYITNTEAEGDKASILLRYDAFIFAFFNNSLYVKVTSLFETITFP